ncbi:MAG: tetratricopeptide repeat protein [Acidobacteriota bacterium]
MLPPETARVLLEALAAYTAPCEETDLVQIRASPPREVREELIACVRLGRVPGGGLGPGTIGPYGQLPRALPTVFVLAMSRASRPRGDEQRRRRPMHRRIADLIERRPERSAVAGGVPPDRIGEHVKGFEAASAGLEAKNNYRNTEALELLGKAVAIAEDAGGLLSDQQVTEALEALADVLMLIGRWPEALEHYDEATVRALKADSRVGAARNHRKSGELLQQMGQLDDARDAYERGLTLLEEGEPSPGAEGKAESAETAVIHAALGFLLGHLRGEYGRGIALLEKALEIGRRLGDGPLQARALNSIGVILNDKGDWEVAVEAYERALHLNEIHGDKLGASANYNNLAIIFEFKGELSQAVTYYRKSLKLDQSMDNLRGVGIDFNNLGSLCFKMGQWTRALGYIGKSRLMALQLGDLALVALAETNLGEVRLHRGDFAVADQHLRRAVEIWKELERADAVAETYAMMGSLCFRARKLGEAEAWFEMADEIATKRDFKIVQAEIARSMAELALAKGDVRGSEDLCVKASRLAHKLSLDDVMGDIYGVFGDVKAAQGDAREALGFFRKSLEVFRRKRIPYKLATALYRYGHHLSREQEDGRPFIEKSLQIFERLGAREDAARARHALGIAGSAGGRE